MQQLKKNVRVPTFRVSLLWALEVTQRLASMGARQALESLLNPIIFPEKRDCAPTKNL
ncbi:hypothetical protein [Leptospira interrogans]|uniref:hypothetical protein n=1 Tax=Leptospira interrogans TaxID=173 RepID=UPI0002D6CD02|nr:hypothetical protein [Leptospira interrogans]